jgi:hypothetical protein
MNPSRSTVFNIHSVSLATETSPICAKLDRKNGSNQLNYKELTIFEASVARSLPPTARRGCKPRQALKLAVFRILNSKTLPEAKWRLTLGPEMRTF